eukprot:1182884-Prorocentrum_minimum.AAC.2
MPQTTTSTAENEDAVMQKETADGSAENNKNKRPLNDEEQASVTSPSKRVKLPTDDANDGNTQAKDEQAAVNPESAPLPTVEPSAADVPAGDTGGTTAAAANEEVDKPDNDAENAAAAEQREGEAVLTAATAVETSPTGGETVAAVATPEATLEQSALPPTAEQTVTAAEEPALAQDDAAVSADPGAIAPAPAEVDEVKTKVVIEPLVLPAAAAPSVAA